MMTQEYSSVYIQNVFKDKPNSVIRWFMGLAMASNDLSLISKLIKLYGDRPETNYFGRLAFSHLREIAKRIAEGKSNREVQTFILSLDNTIKGIYEQIVNELVSFEETSLVKNTLLPIRLECFHYPDLRGKEEPFKDLSERLIEEEKLEIGFSNQDRTLLGHRYLFADKVTSSLMNSRLSSEIVNNLSQITMNLIQFVDHTLALMNSSNDSHD